MALLLAVEIHQAKADVSHLVDAPVSPRDALVRVLDVRVFDRVVER